MIYGITRDCKYYFEHRIIEGIQEGDIFYKQINKEEILKAILKEIELCRIYHADEMIPLFQAEIEKIENYIF